MTKIINKEALIRSPELLQFCTTVVANDAGYLSGSYPNFSAWFGKKVIPGLYGGHRTVVVEERSGQVAGLLILKHDGQEKKLCTLRVRQPFIDRGIGVRLFEAAFDLLDTDRPLLSVSDRNFVQFEKIFGHFGFQWSRDYFGLYLPNSVEHAFNGELMPPTFDSQCPDISRLGVSSLSRSNLANV